MKISGSDKAYALKCRLFKGEEKAIILICNFEEHLQKNEIVHNIQPINIEYKTYNITIEFNDENNYLYKANYNIPFLYSSEKIINVKDSQDKINVEYKFESYNNEPLVLENSLNYGLVPLENCKKEGKSLKCEIRREKLDIISGNENKFLLRYYNDIIGSLFFKFTGYIYLNIARPTYTDFKEEYYFSFPTNITKLPKIKTLPFNTTILYESTTCYLIKNTGLFPLFLICKLKKFGSFTDIDYNGFEKYDIHNKYNFILKSGSFYYNIYYYYKENDYILNVFPEILDFTKEDSLKIFLEIKNPKMVNEIRLSNGQNDLECENKDNIKICNINKTHFLGKESGYQRNHIFKRKIKFFFDKL